MKKICFLSIAVIASALVSCTEEPFSKEDGNEITIEAVMAENNPTRTVIQDGGISVLWEASDEIKVFYDGTGSRFANQFTEPSGTAKFSGSLNVVFVSNEGFSDFTPLWGLYPYRADATADNSSVTTTLPAEQTGRTGSFAKGTNITLGKSSSLTMGFYNVCGGIRFSLTQEGVKEVVFQGQNDEDIAGKVKLAFANGVPAVQEIIDGQKCITLTAPGGGTFETGKWYYIVALPGTLSNGFKMTFNTETQYATLKSSSSKTIKRGIFGSLADADEDLVYKDKEGGEPVTGNIVFADPAAKYACVAKFDTNGDGEVSYEEAEAATSFSGLFDNWKGVVSFEEIRYFKNVHSLSRVFSDCNKLVSITIPENITELGAYAFSGCSSLTSVVLPSILNAIPNNTFQNCTKLSSICLPSSVTSVGQYAFDGCSSLKTIILPPEVISVENYTFRNCSALSSIDIPSSVTSIGQYAFYGCSSLKSIDLPSALKAIGAYAFFGCSSITQVVIPDEVTSLGSYVFSGCSQMISAKISSGVSFIPKSCFENCKSLSSVSIPSSVTSIGDNAFYVVNMWSLELPTSIKYLGGLCFAGIKCVILPSTSPISIASTTFDAVYGVFVPSNMVDMYKVMTNWTQYAVKLHPINTFKEKNDFRLVTAGAVDMGVSIKWAACNVGASRPEQFGGYYAWGETQTKSDYSWSTYLDSPNRDGKSFTKYYYGEGGKTSLDPEDDVAHVMLGGDWRIPTFDELYELLCNCPFERFTFEGTSGTIFYGLGSGNQIFIPNQGKYNGTKLQGTFTSLWSSTLTSSTGAKYMDFYSDGAAGYGSMGRNWGLPIRPVCD